MPTFDQINVSLSRRVGDAVAAATTDGQTLSALNRSDYINQAIRECLAKYAGVLLSAEDQTPGWYQAKKDAEGFLVNYIQESTGALSGNAISLDSFSPAVDTILSVEDDTTSRPVGRLMEGVKSLTDNTGIAGWDAGSYSATPASNTSNPVWYVQNNSLYVIGVTATDTVRVRYIQKHTDLAAGGAAATVVSDTSFTCAGTAVTNFTGVLTSHVGGTLVGLNSIGTPFSRQIVAYVSSTAFTISSDNGSSGSATNGYIIPLASSILVPSQYHHIILDVATALALEDDPDTLNISRAAVLRRRTGT